MPQRSLSPSHIQCRAFKATGHNMHIYNIRRITFGLQIFTSKLYSSSSSSSANLHSNRLSNVSTLILSSNMIIIYNVQHIYIILIRVLCATLTTETHFYTISDMQVDKRNGSLQEMDGRMSECDYMVAQGKWDQSMPDPMTSSGVLSCDVINCDRVSSTHRYIR